MSGGLKTWEFPVPPPSKGRLRQKVTWLNTFLNDNLIYLGIKSIQTILSLSEDVIAP